MNVLTVLFFGLIMPCGIVTVSIWLLLRLGKKRPQQEHTTTRTEDPNKDLEQESYEDSQLEIGSGSSLFPEEPEPENED